MTTSRLDTALKLAKEGFYVFPILPNTKAQSLVKHKTESSRDEAQIKKWFETSNCNVGISTQRFRDGVREALIVLDIDDKDGKNGSGTKQYLELLHGEFPDTLSQTTPSGGRHLIYRFPRAVPQGGANVLGSGLDIRSRGGFICGPSSEIMGRKYVPDGEISSEKVAPCPEWLANFLESRVREATVVEPPEFIDETYAKERGIWYLENEAPLAVKGQGGDSITFKVAARLKDLGVDKVTALEIMLAHWNDRTTPGWSPERLQTKIENAYSYGLNSPGYLAPEAQFKPISLEEQKALLEEINEAPPPKPRHPISVINDDHAFVIIGGEHYILWETLDADGKPAIGKFLKERTFHAKFAAQKILVPDEKKPVPVSRLWMASKSRRSYDGICFKPGKDVGPRWYNLWRGYNVDPVKSGIKGDSHESVQAFLQHAKENVCGNDPELFRWLIGYFAHLVQKPYEKPGTALVFKGLKGTGKSSLVETVGALFKGHALSVANKRYLVGNFNSHLENCLMITLEETFWGGDKSSEAVLKHLVTSKTHQIERKGVESYEVDNLTRVCIIGNEDWVVPASEDERRYAVFLVGDNRRNDTEFFESMRLGMESGGYRYLLRYLLDYDLKGINLRIIPKTEGLLGQKIQSLDPIKKWWHDSLAEGRLQGSTIEHWPERILKRDVREALYRHLAETGMKKTWLPGEREIGQKLKSFCPEIETNSRWKEAGETEREWGYEFADLAKCRKWWSKFLNQEVKWEEL